MSASCRPSLPQRPPDEATTLEFALDVVARHAPDFEYRDALMRLMASVVSYARSRTR